MYDSEILQLLQASAECIHTDWLLQLWSKGPQPHTSYNTMDTETRADTNTIRSHLKLSGSRNFVWIRSGSQNVSMNSDIDTFSNMLHMLSYPVVLLTSDGDRSIPGELSQDTVTRICESEMITAWYTQNYDDMDQKNPKIK